MIARLIRNILVAGILFAQAPVQSAALPHYYYGDWQREPCKTWNIAHNGRDPARERAAEWLAGYIVATAVYGVKGAMFSGLTVADVIDLLDSFCRQSPSASVADSIEVRSLQHRWVEERERRFREAIEYYDRPNGSPR